MAEWTAWHDRHEAKIELIAGVDCWVWVGASGAGGYGRVSYGGKAEMAHRAAFFEAGKTLADGPFVRHLCGNRYCVRPSHLTSATPADNSRDTSEMFRAGKSKLTPTQVDGIRADYDRGVPLGEIAANYGIAYGSVYPIVIGKSFRHYGSADRSSGAKRSPRKLSRQSVDEIRSRLIAGNCTQRSLAKEFGVASSVISRIWTGHRWANG